MLNAWFHASIKAHPVGWACFAIACVWVSGCLIILMWYRHSGASFAKKLMWSVVLLIPLIGWILYGGFFKVPHPTDIPLPPSIGA